MASDNGELWDVAFSVAPNKTKDKPEGVAGATFISAFAQYATRHEAIYDRALPTEKRERLERAYQLHTLGCIPLRDPGSNMRIGVANLDVLDENDGGIITAICTDPHCWRGIAETITASLNDWIERVED